MPLRLVLLCVSCAALLAALPASASAKTGLKVTKLASPASVARGAPLSAKATVRASKKVAKPSSVAFWLSSNRTKGKGDKRVVGGEFVPALKAGKSSARAAVAFVPKSVKLGSYYLLACADNCLASKRRLKVVKPRAAAKVTPHLADANAVSQLVSADAGGTLTATGPDGSTYKLEIPAGALPSDQTIKMTPVASIGGFPFAGAAAGVDLQPEGLMLLKSARLTVSPAHVPPAGRQVTVGWHSGGQGLYLHPISLKKGFVFDIDHFSGYEVADGTQKQVAAQMQRPPISTRDQLWQAVYEVAGRARAAFLADHELDATNLLHDELPPIFQSYFDTAVKPLLEQAKKDDAIVPLALTAGLDWIHDVQALGLVGDPGSPGPLAARRDDVFTQLVAIAEGALSRASDRCIAGDLGQVSRLEALERFAQQLGFSSGDVFQKIRRCLHFELDYNASWSIRQPTANGEDRAHTDFTTKIAGLKLNARVTRSIPEVEVSQPLAYPTYTFTAENGCHADSLASSDEQRPFRVISLDVAAKITTKTDNQGRSTYTTGPPEVTLQMDPGQRTENITYACNQGGGTMQRHWFDNTFKQFHSSEYASNVGIYTLRNWSPGTGGVLATKTYQVPLTGTLVEKQSETSTFTLRHTPQK